jgi:hypothetical protein
MDRLQPAGSLMAVPVRAGTLSEETEGTEGAERKSDHRRSGETEANGDSFLISLRSFSVAPLLL